MTDPTPALARNLAEYEQHRREGLIVEGDEPHSWRDKLAALDNGTRALDENAREWAQDTFAQREAIPCWTERHGKRIAHNIEQWDALHASVGNPAQGTA